MKRLYNLLLLIFGISFVLVATSGIIKLECIFKDLFGIRCPGCGLTRAFKAIFRFNFIEAFNYNILSIPIFVIAIVTFISLIIDIIKNSNKTILYINNFFKKHYIVVIILIVIVTIINNINGI